MTESDKTDPQPNEQEKQAPAPESPPAAAPPKDDDDSAVGEPQQGQISNI